MRTKIVRESEVKVTSGVRLKPFRSSLTCLLACAALSLVAACGDDGKSDGGDAACAGVTCSRHGKCEVKDGAAVCSCYDGYHVKESDVKICEPDEPGEVASCEGVDCDGHGTCEIKDGKAICSCDDGYHVKENDVTSCEADEPGEVASCEGIDCDGHGTCEIKDDTASCNCDDGYHVKADNAVSCEADEPGEVEPAICDGVDCDGHGTCEVKDGTAVCTCDEGYQANTDDPKRCEAVDTGDVVEIKFIEVGDSKTQADIEKKFTFKNYKSAAVRNMIKDGNEKDVYKSIYVNIGTPGDYFEIDVNDLKIDPNEYEDLRVDIDYLVPTVSTNLVSTYGLEVYNNVLGDDHPYYLGDYYPSGYYKYGNGGFYRGYNLVSENLITEDLKKANKKIESIRIVPYGNLPLTINEAETYKGAWRKQTTSFVFRAIKIVGYKKGQYKNPYTTSKTTGADELRLNAALRMYDTATLRWIPDLDLAAVRNIGGVHFSDKILYRKGEVNYGAPYTQRNRVTVEKYASERNDAGIITSIKDSENKQSMDYYGQDCGTSVYYSLAKYIPYEAIQGVLDFTWNRIDSTLLGGLSIKGENESTFSVYKELSTVDYNKKATSNKLSEIPEDVMNSAILESKIRIKSNDSKIKYIKSSLNGNTYDYLAYLEKGISSNEHLYLLLNNLEITPSDKIIKIVYHKYPSDSDVTSVPVFEVDGNKVDAVKQSSVLIESYDTSYGQVLIYENEYLLKDIKSDKKIDSIKIYPYGFEDSEGAFRLVDLVIEEKNGKILIDHNVTKYNLYYGLDKYIVTGAENSLDNNYIKEEFLTAFNDSEKELLDNTAFKSEKEMYGTEMNMIIAMFLAGQAISKAYSELKVGDVVTTNSSLGGIHIRMITGNTHVECMDGEVLAVANDKIDTPQGNCDAHGGINLYKSYYVRTDISSNTAKTDEKNKNNYGGLIAENDYVASREWHPNPKYTDLTKLSDLKDKNLNFYIDYKNSFAHALNTAYLPITLNPYKAGEVEDPMVLLFDKNTLDDIRSGFKGTIYSNYAIININFYINDRGNGKEHSFVVYPSHAPNYKNQDNDYSKGSFNKEGMFGNYYSLFYNLPDDNSEINKLLAKEKLSDDFEIIVSVNAGTGEDMEALHLDTKNK